MTQKELALTLLQSLTDAEIRIASMRAILDTCYVYQHGEQRSLEWRPMVRPLEKTIAAAVAARHELQKLAIQASTDDCPDALSVLAEVAQGLV
jgi:hypothetical protein